MSHMLAFSIAEADSLSSELSFFLPSIHWKVFDFFFLTVAFRRCWFAITICCMNDLIIMQCWIQLFFYRSSHSFLQLTCLVVLADTYLKPVLMQWCIFGCMTEAVFGFCWISLVWLVVVAVKPSGLSLFGFSIIHEGRGALQTEPSKLSSPAA